MTGRSVYIKTLGCKVNTADSHALLTQFAEAGFSTTSVPEEAGVLVVNSCSVTGNAARESRYFLRRLRRRQGAETDPALVVATGCYAQTDSADLMEMPEVDLVVPNQVKDQLVELVERRLEGGAEGSKMAAGLKAVRHNRQGHFKTSANLVPVSPDRTRAFLKIQDGCNGFCTYCLIPYARGASRSVSPQEVVEEIQRLVEQGIQEVVLTGIHIGDFGRDQTDAGAEPFAQLLQRIFGETELPRLRISSLEPRELGEAVLVVLAEYRERFCHHFHLPLQAGSDPILKAMRRSYTTAGYAKTIELARSYFPNATFSADIMAGFPGETAELLQESCDYVEWLGLHQLHVFPYSSRPNTAAARFADHLSPEQISHHAAQLRQLSQRLYRQYLASKLGATTTVLWEASRDQQGRPLGRSQEYLEVVAPATAQVEPNTIGTVKLKGFVGEQRLLGVVPVTVH